MAYYLEQVAYSTEGWQALVKNPQNRIEAVRPAGWNDDALVESVLTVAYFNFINRVSFGLGLVAEF